MAGTGPVRECDLGMVVVNHSIQGEFYGTDHGNTFICAMNAGHFFEVTIRGDVVWKYINPCTRDGIKKIITDNYPTYNAAFRAYRYASDYPGLKGRDLTADTGKIFGKLACNRK